MCRAGHGDVIEFGIPVGQMSSDPRRLGELEDFKALFHADTDFAKRFGCPVGTLGATPAFLRGLGSLFNGNHQLLRDL